MREVVLKEILKLNEADIIYLVPNSTWVSPINVVSNKTEMTIVENERE